MALKALTRKLSIVFLAGMFLACLPIGRSEQMCFAYTLESMQNSEDFQPKISEQRIGGKTFAVGKILIKAKPEQIWQLISDYENAPDLFKSIQKSKIVQNNGSHKLIHQLVRPKGCPMKFDYVIEVSENAPNTMEWHRKSGALKDVRGSWKLEPDCSNHNTFATYAIYIDGGFMLPPWLLKGQSKNLLPEILTSVRNAAERRVVRVNGDNSDLGS